MKLNKYWFEPKSFGYGATPCSWEGWLITAAFLVFVVLNSLAAKEKPIRFFIELAVAIVILFIIVKNKTKGKIKLRWGGR